MWFADGHLERVNKESAANYANYADGRIKNL